MTPTRRPERSTSSRRPDAAEGSNGRPAARAAGRTAEEPDGPAATDADGRPAAGSKEAIDQLFRRYAETRSPEVREELVTAHLDLARQLARRFAHRSEPLDDLIQVASIGLIKAVEGFDPELGFAFSAYATRTILGELKRHFRDRGWSVRAPRRIQELYLQLGPAVENLSQTLGRSPTVPEVAAAVDAGEDEVLEALEAGRGYRSASLDEPGPDGETQQAKLGGDDRGFSDVEERSVLVPALGRLPERERTILRLRFVEDLTQSEIAGRLGISQMHVSRLLSRSLSVLREVYHQEG